MDDITHGAIGAACAQIIFGRKNKQIPWKAGAIAAIAADLDIFIRFGQGPMSTEVWHRNLTHALIFIPLGGLLVALALICFSHFRKHWQVTIGSCFIGYSTHGLLDACTSYGTVLYWPWSDARVSWDVISIIDPVFTLPLLLGTIWSVLNHERKFAVMSLIFAVLFLVFNTVQHQRALNGVEEFAKQQKLFLTHIRAIPVLTSSTVWRVIAKNKNCFLIAEALTPLWRERKVIPIEQVLSFSKIMVPFKLSAGQERDLAIFSWFTDNYLVVANNNPLMIADGRYTMGYNPIFSLWGIQLVPKQDHISKLGRTPISERCSNK